MKKYVPTLLIMLVVVVAGVIYYGYTRRIETEQRMQAEKAALTEQKRITFQKDSTTNAQVDLLILHGGDTVLVSACNKPFFVKRNGITSASPESIVPKDHLTIKDTDPSQFELSFSCTAKDKLALYPVKFITENGKEVLICFLPTQDISEVDNALHYYSNFEIEM